MGSKYRNRISYVAGERFDSQHEANRWVELKLLEKAGEIEKLERQVPFEIIPGIVNENTGRVVQRPTKYIADFVYYKDGKQVVEDAKGYITAEYRIKKKLMLWRYRINIKEV